MTLFVKIGLFEKILIKCQLSFLANFFSDPIITNATSPATVCYSNMSENEDVLIGCDDKNCQIKWSRFKCLRRWFYRECRIIVHEVMFDSFPLYTYIYTYIYISIRIFIMLLIISYLMIGNMKIEAVKI